MASMNRVFLVGNLTRDPEVRYLQSGQAVAEMRLAVTSRYKTQSGEEKEDTVFVDVNVWGRTAENCAQYLSKGSPALVEGRLKLDQWEKDGKKNSKLFVVADRVQFIGAPKRTGEYTDTPGGDEAAPARPAAAKPSARAPASPATAESPASAASEDRPDGAAAGGDDDNLPF